MPSKTFNDPIYGAIDLDVRLVKFIDTAPFQRLHYLRQLGVAFSVYPGASHSRFEHSIGTAHLAGELLKRFKECATILTESLFNEKDALCVKLAALLHDLGHGPFSHFWETLINTHNELLAEDGKECERVEEFKHEQMTLKLIDVIIEDYPNILEETELTDDDIQFIKELIVPGMKRSSIRSKQPLKNFYYEIVSNRLNGNDVDKWDYIRRDSYHVGINTSFEIKRLLKLSRVRICKDSLTHIAWPEREFDNVLQVFEQRKRLHKKVYQHRVIKPVDRHYLDLFRKANEFLKVNSIKDAHIKLSILEAHKDPRVFLNMTDSLLYCTKISSNEDTKKILSEIQNRRFGRFVCEANVDKGKCGLNASKIREDFISYLDQFEVEKQENGVELKTEDVQFLQRNLDFGMKGPDKNPMNHVYLYSKNTEDPVIISSKLDDFVRRNTPKEIMESTIFIFAECEKPGLKYLRDKFEKFCDSDKGLGITPLSHSKKNLAAEVPVATSERMLAPKKTTHKQ